MVTQLHYKDDPLHGPMLDDRYIEFMIRDKDAWEYPSISQVNTQVFLLLEAAFVSSACSSLTASWKMASWMVNCA